MQLIRDLKFLFTEGFACDTTQRRMLRRETAIELPITPSKLQKISEQNQEFQMSNERRAISADNPPRTSPTTPPSRHHTYNNNNNMNYLIPENDQRFHSKKSSESLHKNSSSDNTDYSASAHPYHVIKQNSNDTNSSFNIDNSSFTNDLSLDVADNSSTLNSTIIENTAASEQFPKRASTISSSASDARPNVGLLRKQFSMDQGGRRPQSENLERTFAIVGAAAAAENVNRSTAVTSKISPRIHMNVLKESSSTSTEDAKDELMRRKMIPSIKLQDEIAKLSSNIKSSTEQDDCVAGDDENVETMC